MGNVYRFRGGEGARHEIIEEINWGEDEERAIPLAVRLILNIIGRVLAVVVGIVVMLLFLVRWSLHIVCNLAKQCRHEIWFNSNFPTIYDFQ
jgi:hypothetical protein